MTSTPFHAYYTARILESLQDDDKFIPTFASSDIKVYPYQIGAALFATRSPYSKGVVLMDESGLGKSTEAMLVVTQKWYEGKNRIIILVPNSDLLVQWEKSIESKYSIPFITISNTIQFNNANNTFEQDTVVLTTFDFAVQNKAFVEQIAWDIAVFEEASLLSSAYKEDNKQAKLLKQMFDSSFKVLLTGTPIEKNILDLYGLMYFIDETILPSEQEYMARYFRKPENYPELAEFVSKYCFRTLRSQAKRYAKIPERIVITYEFEQSKEEKNLYDMLRAYIDKPQKYAFPEMNAYDLALMLFDLQGSSTPAIAKSIEGIIARLEKISGAENELGEFKAMLAVARSIKTDEKLKLLIKSLDECFKVLKKVGANKKAVIFTNNRETQQYLYDNLKDLYKCYIYNGSKDYRMIDGFIADGELMITTDQGARGFCFEVASLVVNYDLLYNTLKMEQRIDRCHRLAQQNDVIVLNFLDKSNMADVRKLELVNKRMLVADGVFGQSDAILGGFTDDVAKALKTLTLRTRTQIDSEYQDTLKAYEDENKKDVASAEEVLFTTFTSELAKRVKITPEYVADRVEKVNDDLWELVKWYFDDYNKNHDDCTFTVNEQTKTISATDYVELPYLFYYWSGGQNKRYKALKEFKKITLVSPLAKGIITNIECSDTGKLQVDGEIEACKIAFYTVDILAGNRRTGKTYNLLCGVTDSGKHLSNDECLKILSMPVENWSASDKSKASWLRTHKPGIMDRLISLDEFIEQSIKDTSSAQADEIDRIKRKSTVDKVNLEHKLADIKTEIAELTKQKESATADRMQRLIIERKLGEATNQLHSKEESIYFDAMRIDLACEEDIKKFLENEKINAKLLKHFEIEVVGGNNNG